MRCRPQRGGVSRVGAWFAQYFGLEVCDVGPNVGVISRFGPILHSISGWKCAMWASTRMGEQGWGLVCTVIRSVSVQSGPERRGG